MEVVKGKATCGMQGHAASGCNVCIMDPPRLYHVEVDKP